MIVAVEGPSAAGKTTWCRATGGRFVAECAPNGQEPNGSDRVEKANYWAHVNARRWTQALALEESTGVAICDSDPLKLHYSWCLAAVGASPVSRFEQELAAVRRMFAERRPTLSTFRPLPQRPLQRHCHGAGRRALRGWTGPLGIAAARPRLPACIQPKPAAGQSLRPGWGSVLRAATSRKQRRLRRGRGL